MDWQSIVRNLLLMLGTYIEAHGWMSQAEWAQIVGALIIVGVAIWKFVVARIRKAELAAAIAAPAVAAK